MAASVKSGGEEASSSGMADGSRGRMTSNQPDSSGSSSSPRRRACNARAPTASAARACHRGGPWAPSRRGRRRMLIAGAAPNLKLTAGAEPMLAKSAKRLTGLTNASAASVARAASSKAGVLARAARVHQTKVTPAASRRRL
eukprot:7391888-Prymnesium_polylepis.1